MDTILYWWWGSQPRSFNLKNYLCPSEWIKIVNQGDCIYNQKTPQ